MYSRCNDHMIAPDRIADSCASENSFLSIRYCLCSCTVHDRCRSTAEGCNMSFNQDMITCTCSLNCVSLCLISLVPFYVHFMIRSCLLPAVSVEISSYFRTVRAHMVLTFAKNQFLYPAEQPKLRHTLRLRIYRANSPKRR